jgi:hypothetical protein
MLYEKVDFNTDLIKRLSLEEFVNHKSYQHLWPKETSKKRKDRLKELYNLVNGNNRKPSPKSAKSKHSLSGDTVID